MAAETLASDSISQAPVPRSDLDKEGGKNEAICGKCQEPMDLENMAAQKNVWNKTLLCKSCHSAVCLLNKYMNVSELMTQMSAQESCEFFRKLLEQRRSNGGILTYKTIRSTMLSQLTVRVIEVTKQEASGTYQPLSWWKAQGYDIDSVEAKGMKMEHSVFGWVYRVDLLTVSHSFAREKAEATIQEMEQKVYRKRTSDEKEALKPKPKKAKGAAKTEEPQAAVEITEEQRLEDLEIQDVIDLDVESGGEEHVAAAKACASDKRAAKRAEAALLKEQKKDHKVLSSLAAKALPQLKGLADRLEKLTKVLHPKRDHLPGMTVHLMDEKVAKIEALQAECAKALKDASAGKLVLKDAFSIHSEKDWKAELKSMQECLKALAVAKKDLSAK
eukprot:Skav201239  [mRNA]  locus=scaffold3524:62624:63787:+ [translate_table: standard]